MTSTNKHPWQSGPRELFAFAIKTHTTADDASRRISYLLIDVCVETTFRTFLGLPAKTSGSKVGYSELRRHATGKFHELSKGVKLATGGRVSDEILDHVLFYHNTRNRLYHEGNGMTVPEEHVRGYGTLAAKLLMELLGVDGNAILPVSWKQQSASEFRALQEMGRYLSKEIARFGHAINVVMEKCEPRMVYPSTISKLKEHSEFDITTFGGKLQSFRELLEVNISNKELRKWLLDFLADDVSYDQAQVISNSQFIMELGKDPVVFYSFLIGMQSLPMEDISMETLDNWDDISFIGQDDYSIMGVYESARFFSEMLGKKHWFGMNETQLVERCRELKDKLHAILPQIEKLIPA
ncbi:hypothetical protein ACFL2T_02385 [Elusimicrobiota bacterium]